MKKLTNVLLVDDDPVSNFIHQAILERGNFAENIHVEGNGINALLYLTENAAQGKPLPELILLDINMPCMDGFEFLEQFEESFPGSVKTRVIMVSSIFRQTDIEIINRKEACYLSKPLNTEALMSLLQTEVFA